MPADVPPPRPENVSANGVEALSHAATGFMGEHEVVFAIPSRLLVALRDAWERGASEADVVAAVRDLFDGQDGYLTFLTRLTERGWLPRS